MFVKKSAMPIYTSSKTKTSFLGHVEKSYTCVIFQKTETPKKCFEKSLLFSSFSKD